MCTYIFIAMSRKVAQYIEIIQVVVYILKPFKRVSVDFFCDWIRGVIEYSNDAICNPFVCQFSVCTLNVDIPTTFVPYACAPEFA